MAESSWWDDIADWWTSDVDDLDDVTVDAYEEAYDTDAYAVNDIDTGVGEDAESSSLLDLVSDTDMFDASADQKDLEADTEDEDDEDITKTDEDEDGEESAILGAAKGVIKNKTVQKYLADLVTGSLAARSKDKDRKNALADAMALATHKASLSKSSGGSGETPAATTTPGRVGAVTRK